LFYILQVEESAEQDFQFEIQWDEWKSIAPRSKVYSNGMEVRRMQPQWTHVFAKGVNKSLYGCVLCFDRHHVKAWHSRKSGHFFSAKAHCVGTMCSARFQFEIKDAPFDSETVKVNFKAIGRIYHSPDEINRRHLKGNQREQMAGHLEHKSSSVVYHETLKMANVPEMEFGNFTTAPNPSVIRKIVSEITKKETLHSNIITELLVHKESTDKESMYLREIGYSPFFAIMYMDKQVELLRKNSPAKLFLDATGSVICNIPGQKRAYLYSLVIKEDENLPAVSVADMLSCQHTIPRIEHFLACVKREVNTRGSQLQVEKIETDFSFPLIQSCLHTFNNCTLKTYLSRVHANGSALPEQLYAHHLCSAHMIKNFSGKLAKIGSLSKDMKKMALIGFTVLLNCTELCQLDTVFFDICVVFGSTHESQQFHAACRRLKHLQRHALEKEEEEEEEDEEEGPPHIEDEKVVDHLTIKAASPYTEHFEQVERKARMEEAIQEAEDTQIKNSLHSEAVIECLQDTYLPIVPFWTGMLLKDNTRATSAPVENWFKFLKKDSGIRKHERPYKFVIKLKEAIQGRLRERQFPGARKAKTKRKKKGESDAALACKEEVWKRNKYVKKTAKKPQKIKEKKSFPNVMRWGGKLKDLTLDNTCTVDNVLTCLHMKSLETPTFLESLKAETGVYTTLLTVFSLMDQNKFDEAKFTWLTATNIQIQTTTNLRGDEYDMVVSMFDREWESFAITECDGCYCPDRLRQSRLQHGVHIM